MNGGNGIQPTVELATKNGNRFYPYPIMYGNNGFGNGYGGYGSDFIWVILLLALFGGWGNNGNGGFFGNNSFDDGYAWLSNGQKEIMQNTNAGFNALQLSNDIQDVTVEDVDAYRSKAQGYNRLSGTGTEPVAIVGYSSANLKDGDIVVDANGT